VDVTSGLGVEEKIVVDGIMESYAPDADGNKKDNNNNHHHHSNNNHNPNQIVLSEENEVDDKQIIDKIEEFVNYNFSKGYIVNIKIDQYLADTYQFNDRGTAVLFFEGSTLKGNIRYVIIFYSERR
jgi:hypothetical protein